MEPSIPRPELERQLQALADRHPKEHPYTLALRFQGPSGRVLTGQQVRRLLLRPVEATIDGGKP